VQPVAVAVEDGGGDAGRAGLDRGGGQRQVGLEGEAQAVDLAEQGVEGTDPWAARQDRHGGLAGQLAPSLLRSVRANSAEPAYRLVLALAHDARSCPISGRDVQFRCKSVISCQGNLSISWQFERRAVCEVFGPGCQTPSS